MPTQIRPSLKKSYIFSACTQGEHDDCRAEHIVQNPNDLSQPRVLHVCVCKCHQKERIKEEWKLLMGSCNAGQHTKCIGRAVDANNPNKTYICNCRCHKKEESNG